MNVKEIEGKLRSFGIEDAKTESHLIVERLFGVSRGALLLDSTKDFDSCELDAVLEKRKARIPLQYIFGEWEFMGVKFIVSEDCLIPQPDTEILVEKALEILKKRHPVCDFAEKLEVADLCTGSGCIGLSLLMYGGIDKVMLMDLSKGALNIAKKNAIRYGLLDRCELIHGDITKDMPKKRYDMIVSNPPYIPSGDIALLPEEVKKEPLMALDGGNDGLDIIRFLIGDGLGYLKENGVMLIEFGYDQGDVMDILLSEKRDTGSIKSYEILKDYGNNPRVAVIWAN